MHLTEDKQRFYRESTFRYRDLRSINPIHPFLENSCFFRSKTDFTFDRHVHQNYELVVSENFPYSCILNGEVVQMPAGSVLLVQPGDTHQGVLKTGQQLFVVTFLIEIDSPANRDVTVFRRDSSLYDRIIDPAQDSSVLQIYELFYELSKVESSRSYYVLNGLFLSFFWSVLSLWSDSILHPLFLKETTQEKFNDNLMTVFHKNVYGNANMENLAKEMNMTKRSLERKCRDIIHASPKAAFLDFKFKQIEKHIVQSDFSIKEISDMYGFENQFHFSRLFKKHFSCSPTEYRKMKRN